MRHATLLRTGLSALLVIGAWTAAGPVSASAAPAPAEPPASAALLSAMQRDLGLTEKQALTRLADEKAATALEKKAQRAAYPPSGAPGSTRRPAG